MQFDVFTLFPEVFQTYLDASILQKARQRGLVTVNLHNIRDWTTDRHHVCDDLPYGGGGGMVMKPEPIFTSVEAVLGAPPQCPLILLSPQGRTFNHKVAEELVQHPRLGLLCGRYEGVDELPALMIIDAVARLIPGVLGDPDGPWDDSHASGLLEYPHYTRPPEFRGWGVPEVLLSGDHGKIARWRREQALLRTWQRRPDLLAAAPLSEADRKFLAKLDADKNQQEAG